MTLKKNILILLFFSLILKAEYNIEVKVFLTSKNSFDNAFKLYAALPKIIEHPDDVKILESDLE